MKKFKTGIFALMLAVAAFAITRANTPPSEKVLYYWFQTQENGTVIDATSVPPHQSSDPFSCPGGPTKICSKAFTDFQMNSPTDFAPAGTLEVTHKKT